MRFIIVLAVFFVGVAAYWLDARGGLERDGMASRSSVHQPAGEPQAPAKRSRLAVKE
jgi:hypothetical protein